MTTYYHSAPSEHRGEIERNGLQRPITQHRGDLGAAMGEWVERWSLRTGRDASAWVYMASQAESDACRVCLFADLAVAREWSEAISDESGEALDVWAVTLDDAWTVEPDPEADEGEDGAVYVLDDIPAERLSRIA